MSGVSIQIRKMNTKDIPGVFKLEHLWEKEQIAYLFEPTTEEDFVKTMLKFNDYHIVAAVNDEIIGYINGTIRNSDNKRMFAKETYIMIENIFVKAEYRKNQLGSTLLEHILNKAKSNGITKFIVATDSCDMKSILRFYKRHGFEPFYVQLYKKD